MDRAHLFLAKLEDLHDLASGDTSEYAMIRASAIMRQFFLDASPLIVAINRDIRLPITFTVSSRQAGDPVGAEGVEEPSVQFVNVDPFDSQHSENVSMKKYLTRSTVRISDHRYTVKDVIKCVAHVYGGVHAFEPSDEHEEELLRWDGFLTFDQIGTLNRALLGATRVAVRGLAPLAGAARARA